MYSEKYGTEKVRVLTLAKNRGKGGAVRMVGVIYMFFYGLCKFNIFYCFWS